MFSFLASKWADFVKEFTFVFIEDDRYQHMIKGFFNTLKITGGALIVGIIIGIVIAAIRSSYDKNRESMRLRKGIGYYVLMVLNFLCKLYRSRYICTAADTAHNSFL